MRFLTFRKWKKSREEGENLLKLGTLANKVLKHC